MDNLENRSIFDLYNLSYLKPISPLGVYAINDTLVSGGWGFVYSSRIKKYFNLLPGFGWSKEHLNSVAREKTYTDSGEIIIQSNISQAIRLDGFTCLLSFPGAMTFGHWVVDILPRFYILRELQLEQKVDRYLLCGPKQKWMATFLQMMGIAEKKIIWMKSSDLFFCSNLFVPSILSQQHGGVLPHSLATSIFSFYRNFFQPGSSNLNKGLNPRRVALLLHTPITSSGCPRIYDQRELIGVVESFNGEIINPLHFSLIELYRLLSKFELIVGQDSSALHNLAFTPSNLLVIDPVGRKNLLHIAIQHATNKKIAYIFKETSKPNECILNSCDNFIREYLG